MTHTTRKPPGPSMVAAATAYLATLKPEQKAKTMIAFNAEERFNWHYVPKERAGLPLKEMDETQRKAALELLRAGLSEQGYHKASQIRSLELVLKELENNSPTRDPERYFFTIFGEPSEEGTWGWRYEGHHCSQNWTLVKGHAIATTPQFFGANPADVRSGPMKGTRVLAAEEDLARQLVTSLDAAQKAEAVLATTAPADIVTANQRQVAIQENRGIPYRKLRHDQQGLILVLIEQYAKAQTPELADERLTKLRRAGVEKIHFAWMGGLEKSQGHYYRVQGPTFLIEYDNTQNNANHIHSVWRDFNGDFGLDLLAMHYQASHH